MSDPDNEENHTDGAFPKWLILCWIAAIIGIISYIAINL